MDLGLVKSLGVSNFNSDQCERLVKNCKKYQPQVNQIESHIWFHQTELLEKLTKLKIHMSAYLVCGRGNRIAGQELLKDEYLNKLAKDKYKTTPANFSIKFQTQRGVSAIVKAQSGENQMKNLENFSLLRVRMVRITGSKLMKKIFKIFINFLKLGGSLMLIIKTRRIGRDMVRLFEKK